MDDNSPKNHESTRNPTRQGMIGSYFRDGRRGLLEQCLHCHRSGKCPPLAGHLRLGVRLTARPATSVGPVLEKPPPPERSSTAGSASLALPPPPPHPGEDIVIPTAKAQASITPIALRIFPVQFPLTDYCRVWYSAYSASTSNSYGEQISKLLTRASITERSLNPPVSFSSAISAYA